jgi:hypothetical protein
MEARRSTEGVYQVNEEDKARMKADLLDDGAQPFHEEERRQDQRHPFTKSELERLEKPKKTWWQRFLEWRNG